jgi:hypothetical protein
VWDCDGIAYLNWDPVLNATSYIVERKLSTATTWTVLDAAWPTTTYEAFGYGTYNWRIKANCANGSGDYSVVSSYTARFNRFCDPNLRPNAKKAQMTLNPQPAQRQVNISLNWGKQAAGVLNIRNQYGVSLMQKTVRLTAGRNSMDTDISGLKPGVYILYLQADGQTISQRLVVGNQ